MSAACRWTATAGLLAAIALGALAGTASAAPRPADRVLRHGFVYTVDARRPVAQAVAIRGGRIVYVGSNRGAGAYIGRGTRVTELRGRMAMPGLVDAHVHPESGGAALHACDLDYELLTVAQLKDRIGACLTATRDKEPNGWLEVINWDLQGMRPAGTVPTKADLDALPTRRPIAVESLDGHNLLANSRALALARITRTTPDPPGGSIVRGPGGEPTGLLKDAATSLVADVIPPPTLAEHVADLRTALRLLNGVGVTSLFDAGGPGPRPYAVLRRRGQLTARVSVGRPVEASDAAHVGRLLSRLRTERRRYARGDLHVESVGEVFFDGVMEYPTQTAGLLKPYLERRNGKWVPSSNRGPTYFTRAQARKLFAALDRAGWGIHVHAIGDRAVRIALDGFAAARRANGRRGNPDSIDHLELVDPTDVPRFRRLGVSANFQLQWAQRDAYTIDALRNYIGLERFRRLYPAGDLLRAGADLTGGSDWPVDPLNPWRYVEQAVTRTGAAGYGAYRGALGRRQALGRRTVLATNTLHAARQLRLGRETGSLAPGKRADLIVLDRNVLRVPARRIHATKVLLTLLGGRAVHRTRGL